MMLIDKDEVINGLKDIVSECSSHGTGQYIPAYEYAIQFVESMNGIEIGAFYGGKKGMWMLLLRCSLP